MNHRLTVARTYYFYRTCGQGWLPLDETLVLPPVAATPALFEAGVTCGSVAPPEEAADLLARLAGVTLSPKSVERYTKAAVHAVEQAVAGRAQRVLADPSPGPAARPDGATSPARPYNVQFDGSMLRMRQGGFREVKVGCLFDARDLAAGRPSRRELLRQHHEVHLGGPDPLGDRMYAAARAAGVTADGSNAISQGDGAPWVWHLVQLHWPAAREALDFYRLSEHLHACAQAVWGVGNTRARAWARAVGEQALQGDAGVLRQALGHLRPTTVTGQQAVAALRRYVQTHAARLDYGALRAEGYAVASAAVESAHHSLVQRRCKRPGQRWSERGLRAILAARRLWCNGDSPVDVTSLGAVRHLVGPRYHHRAA